MYNKSWNIVIANLKLRNRKRWNSININKTILRDLSLLRMVFRISNDFKIRRYGMIAIAAAIPQSANEVDASNTRQTCDIKPWARMCNNWNKNKTKKTA